MNRSYMLPMRKESCFAQAQIFNFNKYVDYLLLVDPKYPICVLPDNARLSRNVIVYMKNKRSRINNFFANFVKIEVEKENDLMTILSAVKKLFPDTPIFVVLSAKSISLMKKLQKEYILLDEDECFK